MKALRINELQYGQMVWDNALLWMDRYFGTQPIVKEALESSKSFRLWWVNQWDNRDQEFLNMTSLAKIELPLDNKTHQYTTELYQDHHNVDQLRIIPNRFVVREVGKLIKIEETRLEALKREQSNKQKSNG